MDASLPIGFAFQDPRPSTSLALAPTSAPLGYTITALLSAHLQPKVDGGEQAFADWAGEIPPPKGVAELGH